MAAIEGYWNIRHPLCSISPGAAGWAVWSAITLPCFIEPLLHQRRTTLSAGVVACLFVNPFWGEGGGGSLCWRQTNNSLFSSPPCFSVFYSLDSPRTSVRGRRGIYRSWAAGCCDGWFRNWSLFFVPLLNNPPKEKLFFRVPNISIILTYFRCLKRTRKGRDDSSGAAMFFI